MLKARPSCSTLRVSQAPEVAPLSAVRGCWQHGCGRASPALLPLCMTLLWSADALIEHAMDLAPHGAPAPHGPLPAHPSLGHQCCEQLGVVFCRNHAGRPTWGPPQAYHATVFTPQRTTALCAQRGLMHAHMALAAQGGFGHHADVVLRQSRLRPRPQLANPYRTLTPMVPMRRFGPCLLRSATQEGRLTKTPLVPDTVMADAGGDQGAAA